MDDREQQARRSIEGFGNADWEETVRELVSPHIVYEETGSGRRLDGIEVMLDGLRSWKAAFPDVQAEILRVVSTDDTTVLEVVWFGTHTGPLDTGAAVLPATGTAIRVSATMWQQWADGQIIHERHHLDMLAMLGQLGALPVEAAAS